MSVKIDEMKKKINLELVSVLTNPDLMEMRSYYLRDGGLRIKILLDHCLKSGAFSIVYKEITEEGIKEDINVIPNDLRAGSGPAADFFDAIDLDSF
jgi:hypothetical protein